MNNMTITQYLENVKAKIEQGYTKEAKGMLTSLRGNLDSSSRIEGYKPSLRLKKDLDLVDNEEVYVLTMRPGTSKYNQHKIYKMFKECVKKLSDMVEEKEAQRPAEPSLENRVQGSETLQDIREGLPKLREIIKDFRQNGYTEEPVPAKQGEYNVRNPIQTVSEVTESALREVKRYREELMPESLRLYLRDAYNEIEEGKLADAETRLGKISKETKKRHPETMQSLYEKLRLAKDEKEEKSNAFWNKCKRAAAYGLVAGLLLGFTGLSVKHELKQRAMDKKQAISAPLRGGPLQFEMGETGLAYKWFKC